MRLVFCGTPQFAVPTLRRLVADGFVIPLVLTNPDEPRGRGYALTPSPVKEVAIEVGMEVYQPVRLKDPAAEATISAAQPEAIVVVAYGHIIPSWMIDLPRYGCINLHASLLPRYRGAAPIPWAIIQGESVTGVTTMKIDPGLDTGDILLQREAKIEDDDTTATLSARLSEMGAELMVKTLSMLERNELQPRPQDNAFATRAPMLKKQDGQIVWSMSAEEIARRVRAFEPWPVAHTTYRGRNLRLWAARPGTKTDAHLAVGELREDGGRLLAGCGGNTVLEVLELQLEGRKRVAAREFLNGVRLAPGEIAGAEAQA